MDKKPKPSDDLLRAFERVRQAIESMSSAKSPGFYVQMAVWVHKTATNAARLFRGLPTEAGSAERAKAAATLDELCAAILIMLNNFRDTTLAHEDVRASMDAIPPKVAEVSKEMVRALVATAGGSVSDEEISVEEARARIVKALVEAKRPESA